MSRSEFLITVNGEEWVVTSDNRSWIFGKYGGEDDEGRTRINQQRWVKNIDHLVRSLHQYSLKESSYSSVQDIKENQERIAQEIKEQFDNHVDLQEAV